MSVPLWKALPWSGFRPRIPDSDVLATRTGKACGAAASPCCYLVFFFISTLFSCPEAVPTKDSTFKTKCHHYLIPAEQVPLWISLQVHFKLTSFREWLAKGKPWREGGRPYWLELLGTVSHRHYRGVFQGWTCLDSAQTQAQVNQLCITKGFSLWHSPK